MAQKLKIITDTGADLMPEFLYGKDIGILSMEIEINGKERKMSDKIDIVEMYENMKNKAVYKTSQVSLEAFLKCFEKYAKDNIPIVYLGLSSGLSGTHSAAALAAQEIKILYPNAFIEVIDTKCASMGYGRVVLEAYEMIENGHSTEEVLSRAHYLCEHMEHLFTVSSLEYLVRGGRLSAAAAAVAGTLNIKPIINVNKTGHLVTKEKIRGDKKLKQRMADLVVELSGGLENQDVYIVHGNDIALANEMIELIKERTKVKSFTTSYIGCTIGCHSGPGTVGIVFINPNRV